MAIYYLMQSSYRPIRCSIGDYEGWSDGSSSPSCCLTNLSISAGLALETGLLHLDWFEYRSSF